MDPEIGHEGSQDFFWKIFPKEAKLIFWPENSPFFQENNLFLDLLPPLDPPLIMKSLLQTNYNLSNIKIPMVIFFVCLF